MRLLVVVMLVACRSPESTNPIPKPEPQPAEPRAPYSGPAESGPCESAHDCVLQNVCGCSCKAVLLTAPRVEACDETCSRDNACANHSLICDLASHRCGAIPRQPAARRPPAKSAIVARTRTRRELAAEGAVPKRAIIVSQHGLASSRRIAIDLDSGAVAITGSSAQVPFQHRVTIAAAQLADLEKLVAAARTEVPHGDPAMRASDSFERLDLVDGDQVFELEGHPINIMDGPTDRPAAANLLTVIADLTP